MSYFLANPTGAFPRIGDPVSLLKFAVSPTSLVVFAGIFVVSLSSLKGLAVRGGAPASGRMALAFLLGLALATLSAVMTSLCPRYQNLVRFGVGYLPVYIQYFGVGLLLGAPAWLLLSRATPEGKGRTWARVLTAVLLASITAVTYRSNAFVVDQIAKGSWTHHRENLASALRAGLLDDVPEHSVVFLENEYPAFHDHPHSAYFYAMHTGKVLRTVPATNNTVKDGNWFVTRPKPPTASPEAASDACAYRVRDVCMGEKRGYVVLSRREARGRTVTSASSSATRGSLRAARPLL